MNTDQSAFGTIDALVFLKKYLLKHKRTILFLLIGWLLQGILTIVLPILFGILIDEMVYYKDLHTFLQISLVILVLSTFLCALYFVIYTFHIHLNGKYAFDIRMDLFSRLLSLETNDVYDSKAGDIINTIQSYSKDCVLLIKDNVIYAFLVSLYVLLYMAYIFAVDWRIGIFVLILAPLSAFLTMRNGVKIRRYSDKYRSAYGQYAGWLLEMLNGLKDIRLLRAERIVQRGFTKHHKELFQVTIKKNVYSLNLNKLIELVNLVMQLSIFGVGAYLTHTGSMTIGMLVVIIGFFGQIKFNIVNLNQYYVNLQDRLAAVKYLKDFMNRPTEPNKGNKALVVSKGEIDISNVSFSYLNRPAVLNNLSLFIHPNEKIALVGQSGVGKTTLVNMLIGFQRPEQGTIRIDGQNILDCSLRSLRSQVGIAQQNVLIFDTSIRENLRLSNLKATDEQILDACEKMGIMPFIQTFNEGLDTVVGSQGVNLSGGQKQLIAITRMYLKHPKIVIFDEATSALDSETETMFHRALDTLFAEKTVLIISHKFSTVMQCDRVVLLDNGTIVEDGYTPVLLQGSERFRQLFSLDERSRGGVPLVGQ
jgi:ABC-type bacteriocin/lantibiotic exporter with double-glycine peptidase domain